MQNERNSVSHAKFQKCFIFRIAWYCAKLLVVYLQEDTGMTDYTMHICNQCTNLLTQLKSARISTDASTKCFDAIILASVLYASPAMRGYLNDAMLLIVFNSCFFKQSDSKLCQIIMVYINNLIICDMVRF